MSANDETVNEEKPGAPGTVCSGARVVMGNVAALHQDLLAAFAVPEAAVTLDLSALEEGDFSLIQLVLAAQAQARRDGRAFAVQAPPESILPNLLQRAGIAAGSPDAAFCSHGVFNA